MQPTKRFSKKAKYYHLNRPRYPEEIITILKNEFNWNPPLTTVADIGSGTGILSELFLKAGSTVFGVEPNEKMRKIAEVMLKDYSAFISVDGSAESTGLEAGSIDLITAGQSFHWFDLKSTKQEFKRILKPRGLKTVVIVWNIRKKHTSPFFRDYEKLLVKFGIDYDEMKHDKIDHSVLNRFYGSDQRIRYLENYQTLDFEGVRGRLLS
ncbi:MAG: class I SAM-dependent methyltransferase, partial [Candidatus Heimdallarchaeota archaeon]